MPLFCCLWFVCTAVGAEQATVPAPKNNEGTTIDKTRLVFDHQLGAIISPIPAQLEVKDGEVFVIQFLHTDPTKFNYELKAIGGADIANISLKTGTESVAAGNLADVTVTWRHDRHFPVYQVTVSLREDSATPVIEKKSTHESG